MATALGFPAEDLKEVDIAEWKIVGHLGSRVLVTEQCFDLLSDNGHVDFLAQRCVQCGELVDPVILRNRRLRPRRGLEKSEEVSKVPYVEN